MLSNFDSLLLKKLAASFASMTQVGIAEPIEVSARRRRTRSG
jgi:hypothetical protein